MWFKNNPILQETENHVQNETASKEFDNDPENEDNNSATMDTIEADSTSKNQDDSTEDEDSEIENPLKWLSRAFQFNAAASKTLKGKLFL